MNICISREFGSGGHEIGKILAEQLGYSFYDRRLLEGAAEKSRIPIEHLERADEQKANPWIHRIWYEAEDESGFYEEFGRRLKDAKESCL